MAQVVRLRDVKAESYEVPLKSRRGIDTKRSGIKGKPKFTMSRTIIPAGARNQRHYHINNDAGMHILSGNLRMFFGPSHQQQQEDVEAGDFVYIAQGEIHGLMNLSDTEPAEILTCYGGVSNWEEAETVFMEPPWHNK
jgi:uncharacterized RmlC-like cupin family protein